MMEHSFVNQFFFGDRIEAMQQNIPNNSIDLIITSPPYNVGIDYDNHNDLLPYSDYLTFLNNTWIECKRVLKRDGRIAINVPSVTADGSYQPLFVDVTNQLRNLGFLMRCDILWYKQAISKRTAWGSWQSPSNPHVVQPYEFILVFSKETKTHDGEKHKIDITKDEFISFSNSFWDIKPETQLSKFHPAPFPEELAYRLIKFYSYQDDIVLDPFGGSGTVANVAVKTNRRFVYIDNSEEYLDFAKKRVQNTIEDMRCNLFTQTL